MAESTSAMLKIERMGGASALARHATARSVGEEKEEEERSTGEISQGSTALAAARWTSSATRVPPDPTPGPKRRNSRENRRKILDERIWVPQKVAEKQPPNRGDVARLQRPRSAKLGRNQRMDACHSTCDSGRTVGRRTAQTTPADPPHRTA